MNPEGPTWKRRDKEQGFSKSRPQREDGEQYDDSWGDRDKRTV